MKPNGWILNAIIASMLITGAVSAMEDLEIKCEGSKRPALVAAIPAGKSSEPAEILSSNRACHCKVHLITRGAYFLLGLWLFFA